VAAKKKSSGLGQMVGVVLGGLAFAALSERSSGAAAAAHSHTLAAESGESALVAADAAAAAARSLSMLYGLGASAACALCYGVVYTLAELLMAQPSPPRAQAVASRVGAGICAILGSYVAAAVLPRWRDVAAHVSAVGLLSWGAIAACYATMVASAVAHSITYFQIMGRAGAVATGIMQAARAVGVFFVSAVFFCLPPGGTPGGMLSANQCFTQARGVCAVLVCGGILLYSSGKAAANAAKRFGRTPSDSVSLDDISPEPSPAARTPE
jgi:hypothetical protein